MAKYLHLFDTVAEFEAAYGDVEPWVSYTEENEHVDYNKKPVHIPIRFTSHGEVVLTKYTDNGVLTLTVDDIYVLARDSSIYFQAENSVLDAMVSGGEITFSPAKAYGYVVGGGVSTGDAPVVINFGQTWLEQVLDCLEHGESISVYTEFYFHEYLD